jgi:3-oxoacyl-[acyl-carrier protein] reductase
MAKLDGKVALVTGASRGVGAETARLLAAAGADVVVNYRSKERRAREVADAVEAAGRGAAGAGRPGRPCRAGDDG